jgi:transposase
MLTLEEDVEINALAKRGWTISAIARHVGRDRKTVRAYLRGERSPGERRPAKPDGFEPFVAYVRARFDEDPHLWATTLFDELVQLGFARSYQTFTRQLRARRLRPRCEACAGVAGRATVDIDHPPGEEIQWDWVELGPAPWGGEALMLVGSLPFSGRFRGVLAEAMDQPHLIEALDGVLRRLGGTAGRWRVDRMATVIDPGTGRLQASFAPVAKHYGVTVAPCPPRRGNRKGSVEKSIHYATGRWWRTTTATTMAAAQADLDRWCTRVADRRSRPKARLERLGLPADRRPTVAELAEAEPLRPLPELAYPATVSVERRVDAQALVAFRGNRYSVPPGLVRHTVTVRWRLSATTLEIVTEAGAVAATHRLAPPGAGQVVRDPTHRGALEAVVLDAFTTDPPCRRKANRPPGERARAEAARLLAALDHHGDIVVDLAGYGRAAGEAQEAMR